MKQYYIYLGTEQVGPLSFDELKEKKILAETMVWHEGLEQWQKANTVEELKTLFRPVPPPIPVITPPKVEVEPAYTYQTSYEPIPKESSKTKKIFLYVAIFVTLFLGVSAFSAYQSNQQSKQQELEMRIAEQERIATEAKIKEISNELSTSYQNLEAAKRQLNDVTAFKFLRSASKRNEQVNAAEDVVKSWQINIEGLEREMRSINPNWVGNN